jgi:soluble lytic murein transglycosylase-like protein
VYGNGDPYDGEASLQAWGKYMTKLLRQFNGRYDLALAGYNSGENRNEYRNAARENRQINWEVFNTPKLRGVYTETQNYVKKILAAAQKKTNTPKPQHCPTCRRPLA